MTDSREEVVLDLEIQTTEKPALQLAIARKIHGGFYLMNGPGVFKHG